MPTWFRFAAAALAVLLLGACGAGSDDSSATPGYSGDDRTVDTSPFTMIRPGADAPTTLPPEVFSTDPSTTFPAPRPPTTTTTLPPTTTTSTSTTTTTLPTPGTPSIDSITNICGFSTYVSSFYGLSKESPARVKTLMSDLVAVLNRLTQVVPADLEADVTYVRDRFTEIQDVLRDARWNARSKRFREAIDEIIADTSPTGLQQRLQRLVWIEAQTCG